MIVKNENNSDINTSNIDTDAIKEQKSSKSVSNIDNIIDPKDDQIIQLEIKLAQLEESKKDIVLRLKAEIENIRRRNIQEIEKTHKFALERFIVELLPVIDNLERTVNSIDRSNDILPVITEGIDLTLKSFLDTIHKFGIESVDEVNVPFNPEIHQAISTVNSEEHKPNYILTIIQKGYLLNGRLIRPAMVTVVQSKS